MALRRRRKRQPKSPPGAKAREETAHLPILVAFGRGPQRGADERRNVSMKDRRRCREGARVDTPRVQSAERILKRSRAEGTF